MIATAYLNEWRQTVPWSDNKMVEQDLIISRLLVELFNHPKISGSLAFRGGTAIYKLFAPHPVRYSEHMLVRMLSAEDYALQVEKEQRWLPKLAPKLPLPTPVPLGLGEPANGCPWTWPITA